MFGPPCLISIKKMDTWLFDDKSGPTRSYLVAGDGQVPPPLLSVCLTVVERIGSR